MSDDFDAFYRGTRQRVLSYVYVLTGSVAEAQDCVQEAYMRAWLRWGSVGRYDERHRFELGRTPLTGVIRKKDQERRRPIPRPPLPSSPGS